MRDDLTHQNKCVNQARYQACPLYQPIVPSAATKRNHCINQSHQVNQPVVSTVSTKSIKCINQSYQLYQPTVPSVSSTLSSVSANRIKCNSQTYQLYHRSVSLYRHRCITLWGVSGILKTQLLGFTKAMTNRGAPSELDFRG